MSTTEQKLKTITDLVKPYYNKYNKKIINEYGLNEYDNKFLDALIDLFIHYTKKVEEEIRSDILEIVQERDYIKIVNIVSRLVDIYKDGEELGGFESLKEIMEIKDFEQLINKVINNVVDN